MASRRNPIFFIAIAVLVATPLAAWALGAFDGPRVQPETGEAKDDLLARAITALGGAERLTAVRCIEIRAEGKERGRSMDTRLAIRFPDAYRQDVDTSGGRLVHAISGDEAWASLDGTPVSLSADESQRLRAQLQFTRIALLVDLRDQDDYAVSEIEAEDGDRLRWLEVKPAAGGVPYRLGFDPTTFLITRAIWETVIPGLRRPRLITADYDDYREVDGVMVAFQATYRMGEQVFAVNRILEAALDATLRPAVFTAPKTAGAPTIVARRIAAGLALVVEPLEEARPEDAEKAITTAVQELGLERNGPLFHRLSGPDLEPQAVGLPVDRPAVLPEITPVAGRPRLVEVPAREVLTLVLIEDDPEVLAEAGRRLRAEATRRGRAAGAGFKLVKWNKELSQLQLLLDPR